VAVFYRISSLFLILSSILLAADYLPDRLIIKLRPYSGKMQSMSISAATELPDAVRQLNQKYSIKKVKVYGTSKIRGTAGQAIRKNHLANFVILEFTEEKDIDLLLKEYASLPEIELAQPVYRYRIVKTPNEPDYGALQADYMDLISAEAAWDITTGNSSVLVAVIDSGILTTHEDLNTNVVAGWDFIDSDATPDDNNGHGTMVAGIIGAVGDNGTGIAGICWNCQIMPLKVLDQWGYGNTQGLIDALEYARTASADIINLSLGQTAYDAALEAACDNAAADGSLLIAAMGNVSQAQYVDKDTIMYPAAFYSVMGVGAVNSEGSIADFSVIGSYPYTTEITAPGVDIVSTYIGSDSEYRAGDGTSFAAPMVSGVAALIKSNEPGLSNENIRTRLQQSANDTGRPGKDSVYGYGILNAFNAVTNNIGSSLSADKEIEELFNFPNPINTDKTTFIFTAKNSVEQVTISIYDLRGELLRELSGGSNPAGEYRLDWDLTDKNGRLLLNGSYIYLIKIKDSGGSHRFKEILSIAR